MDATNQSDPLETNTLVPRWADETILQLYFECDQCKMTNVPWFYLSYDLHPLTNQVRRICTGCRSNKRTQDELNTIMNHLHNSNIFEPKRVQHFIDIMCALNAIPDKVIQALMVQSIDNRLKPNILNRNQ